MMFLNADALGLLILIPLAMLFFYWRTLIRRDKLRRLIGQPELLASMTGSLHAERRALKSALWLIAVSAVIVALARPTWGTREEPFGGDGVALVIALDVSSSMNATDVLPSRLERAKLAAQLVFSRPPGDQLGLILFAGTAIHHLPLTDDNITALTFLEAASSQAITQQGTAIDSALQLALDTFDPRLTDRAVILLMTDGENHTESPLEVAQQAADRGVVIHTIGYGTLEGAPVPDYDVDGRLIGYKADASGQLVTSRLNEDLLQRIAQITGGLYRRAGGAVNEMNDIIAQIDQLDGVEQSQRSRTRPVERFDWFVALALMALAVEMLLSEYRAVTAKKDTPTRTGLLLILVLLIVLSGCGVNRAEQIAAGNRDYRRGSYTAALTNYQQAQVVAPDAPEGYFNAGLAHIGAGDLERAEAAFDQAIRHADGQLLIDAHYNLGNVHFERGRYSQAISAYQAALLLDPNDADARYNLELALLLRLPPTPTAQEQQTQPNSDSTDPTMTPTDQPGGVDVPTPTPTAVDPDLTATPQGGQQEGGQEMGTTPQPSTGGRMSVEEAQRLLDQVRESQEALREFLQEEAAGEQIEGADW